MDVNLVLLWLVALSSLAPLRAAFGAARGGRPAGLVVLLVVMAGTGLAAALDFTGAGRWGALLFGLLVLLPALLQRRVQRLVGSRRFAEAALYTRALALVHPARSVRLKVPLFEALAAARRGDLAGAEARLAALSTGSDAAERLEAALQLARLRGDWAGYLERSERLPDASLRADPGLLLGRLRALGECGELDRLVATHSACAAMLAPAPLRVLRALAELMVLAFCGRTEATARLASFPVLGLSPAAQQSWRAIAACAAGDLQTARATLEAIVHGDDADLAIGARRCLAEPPRPAREALSPQHLAALDALERAVAHELQNAGTATLGRARLILLLVALNLVAFLLEEGMGGSEDGLTLYRLGALVSEQLTLSESYRLVAKLFLHYGPLHLGLNMAGLLAIGPPVERALGWLRTLALYLSAGIAGSLLEALLPSSEPQLFVGASGCIMGLLGATAAILIKDFRRQGTQALKSRLGRIGFVLVAQLAFDLTVPNISLIAHWIGVAVGFLLGLGFAQRPQLGARATGPKQNRNGGMSADVQGS